VTRAVFLDRDGTLIEESGYLSRLDRLEFFPFSIDAVRLLNRVGFAVIVVSNQSGIARGIVSEAFVIETHRHIMERLAAGGARLDGYYYCPHHPDATLEPYRQECDCRKPRPGLLLRAARERTLDVSRSFVVGDRWHDLEAGQAAGAAGVLVRTGYGRLNESAPSTTVSPAAVVDNLVGAVSWILQQS
jgi:D-glycero-D-manno-heptose 1,7-bisphosphate phosphatase